jgi:hypothetical protein
MTGLTVVSETIHWASGASGGTSVGRKNRHRARRALVPAIAQVVGPLVMLALVVATGFYALGGDGAGDNAQADPPRQLSTQREAPSVGEVGQTRSREEADTTLLQVRKILAPQDRQAPAGQEWFGIRARTCMHADARASGRLAWSTWVVTTQEGRVYRGAAVPWKDFPPQQLPTTPIQPGECQVGWVLVEVPKGTFKTVDNVSLRLGGATVARWAI